MPIKIKNGKPLSIKERIDAFRQTIKRGEGYTMQELADIPHLHTSRQQADSVCRRHRWTIPFYDDEQSRLIMLLVHPKDLAAHAKKT